MLSSYQTELAEIFTPGEHFDHYSSFDEMLEKADYYLNHDSIRREIAHNGYEKVLKEYNYPLRLVEMMTKAFEL